MEATQALLERLKGKIETLIKSCSDKEDKILKLEQVLKEKENIVINLENKLKEKEKENMAIKLGNTLGNGDENGEILRKIIEMVREIDTCIAYLNK